MGWVELNIRKKKLKLGLKGDGWWRTLFGRPRRLDDLVEEDEEEEEEEAASGRRYSCIIQLVLIGSAAAEAVAAA